MTKFFISIMLITCNLQAAVIKNIKGTVTINSVRVDKEKKVGTGDQIAASGKGSSVQIFFDDGSRSMLRNGRLSISEDIPQEKTLLTLAKGILFTSKAKSKSNLQVKTKNTVMGIRGTKFYVEESTEDTYLCVCEGIVEIKNDRATTLVEKNEDVHSNENPTLKKSPASDDMLKMAWDGFNEMGIKRE